MKLRNILLILVLLLAGAAKAQDVETPQHRQWNDAYMQQRRDSLVTDSLAADRSSEGVSLYVPWQTPVPCLGAYGLGGFPSFSNDAFSWRLHEGFNAQFGLSVTAGLGKHSPRGAGFGQTAAFAYVLPLGKKFYAAAGIMANNFDWGAFRRTDVGIGGVIAYQPSDRVTLYAYGQKSFLPRTSGARGLHHDAFLLSPFDFPRDRIGVAGEFKIGNNAMIGISVERASY